MEKVYPKIEENILPSAPLIEVRQFNDILDKEKMNSINDKIKAIQTDLKRYCKVRKDGRILKLLVKLLLLLYSELVK